MSSRKKRILFRVVILPPLLIAAFVLFCNLWVVLSTKSKIYDSIDEIKNNQVGLVLGTSKKVAPTRPNPHFEHRMAAAAELYREGKIKHLLVSGDGGSKYYNEPRDMTAKLMALGVNKEAITSDNSGFRTLDSMIRAEEIYQLNEVTIISDGFHVGRALFIANKVGLDAIAFSSQPVKLKYSTKTRLREYLARVLVVLDLYVFDTRPEKLGEPVEITLRGSASGGVKTEKTTAPKSDPVLKAGPAAGN